MPHPLDDYSVLDLLGERVRLGDLWSSRTAVLLFVRHFGCVFCHQQVAAMTPSLSRIREAGAELFIIGNGSVQQARAFRDTYDLPMPIFTDPARATYAALGMRRGPATILHPLVLLRGARAVVAGFRQKGVAGDPLQQGGVLIVEPGGRERYRYISRFAGDHPSPDAILRQCRSDA
jgi:peroxiredoxin